MTTSNPTNSIRKVLSSFALAPTKVITVVIVIEARAAIPLAIPEWYTGHIAVLRPEHQRWVALAQHLACMLQTTKECLAVTEQ